MRFNWASNASKDLPNATKTSPAWVASAQGMERRQTKASGVKLSCAVRFTCAVSAAKPAPQRGGCRGNLHAFALVVGKRAQAFDLLLQREREERADADDAGLAVRNCGQRFQLGVRARSGLQCEGEIAGVRRNR